MKLCTESLLFLALLVLALFGCGQAEQHTYSADPVYARVVDADTGKPIQGVAVVAYWELYQGSITGDGMPCGAANVEEAVTDKDGRFHIPGWGPVTGACGRMRNGNPLVYFFKPGYVYLRKSSGVGFDYTKEVSVAQVWWNGQTIKLHKFPNLDLRAYGLGSYAADFGSFNSELAMFVVNRPGECNWRKIPSMLREIITQRKAFTAVGNYNFAGSIDLTLMDDAQNKLMQKVAPQCGSPREFVEGLAK